MVKDVSPASWLVFLPQPPGGADYARVKLWRRLQPLGAVGLRAGVYVLPNTPEAREDLEWLAQEVTGTGGSAVLCEASFLAGVTDDELRARFRERAEFVYQDIATRARASLGSAHAHATARRLRRQLDAEVRRLDFGAAHRADAERALAELEASGRSAKAETATPEAVVIPRPRAGTWVTREEVFVDRIASAWLIRRFIDPRARFKFVPGPRYAPRPGEIRFDMFQAEYTHRGEWCTFETLLHEFRLTNPALHAIAEIVHDIDLKDARYERPETEGIHMLLQGLVRAHSDDTRRLKAGAQIFDSLFAQLSVSPL